MTSIGSPSPFFLAGKKAYEVERSLRFNNGDSPYLRRDPTSTSNRKTSTLSVWLKRTKLSTSNSVVIFSSNKTGSSTAQVQLGFESNNTFTLRARQNGTTNGAGTSTAVFRDPSAWYHIVYVLDTTQATNTNRFKLYVNGEQQTISYNSYPAQNGDLNMNLSGCAMQFGAVYYGGSNVSNRGAFYLAEVNWIDGQAYDPSYFAETNPATGQWNPKKYTGSYGTNGFYLNFSDNSGTTATTLGKDSSGNGNNFTPNNFAVSDAVKDSPTNNFATLDVLAESGGTYSEGNLKVVGTSDPSSSTIGFASSKFYYEAYIDATSNIYVGVIPIDYGLNPARGGGWDHGAIAYRSSGQQYKLKAGGGYSSVSASYGASYTAGDIIGCAVDIDNDTVTFYKNGVSQGNTSDGVSYITASGTTSIYGVIVYCNGGNNTFRVNFGQDSTFQGTVSAGGNTDANGIGDFKYTVPSGYKALCSANLPDPTIKLPNKHFGTILYTGNGADDRNITDSSAINFTPDWVWIKSRNQSEYHSLFDAVRGANKSLYSNHNQGEESLSETFESFDSNGFTVGYNSSYSSVFTNKNSTNYAAWNWNAGDTDGTTYAVTVVSDSGNKYRFDGFGTSAVTLDLAEGGTYIFNMDDASNASHPFSIGTAANGTVYTSGITYFLDGVSKTYSEYTSGFAAATTRRLHITVPASAPVLYYWCSVHSGMGGQINTNSTLGSSNFDGTLQATVKANATAGFSIVTWTGNQTSGATLGHGLGVAPKATFVKRRDGSGNWISPFFDLQTAGKLNATDAFTSNYYNVFFTSQPSSTLLTIGSNDDINRNTSTYVAYVFSEVAGYSKFGSYTGNGSSDGTFVFTGFRPAWIMIKRTDTTKSWAIFDNKRDPDNVASLFLYANSAASENNADFIDFLSNGFKFRTTSSVGNDNGNSYIYFAFAESPFKNARAR